MKMASQSPSLLCCLWLAWFWHSLIHYSTIISSRAKVIQNFGLPWMGFGSALFEILISSCLDQHHSSLIIRSASLSSFHWISIIIFIFIITKVFSWSSIIRSSSSLSSQNQFPISCQPSFFFIHVLSSSSNHLFLKSSSYSSSLSSISYWRAVLKTRSASKYMEINKEIINKVLTIRVADVGLVQF